MDETRRSIHQFALAASVSLLAGAPVFAADAYPVKPIRLIVPFAPGGGNDTLARLIGQTISGPLGQAVIIENKPGAGGAVGAEQAARAAADGYTVFLGGVGSHAVNPTINPKLGYDPIKDFAPIVLIASAPMVLAVHPSVPVNSIKELIAYAHANPGKLNFSSNGNGSSSQLAAVIFNSMAKTDMVHVPYKGLSPALVDLVSGKVDLMFSSVVAIMPMVQAGKLKALGVTSPKRLPAFPQIPTIASQGLPGYESGSWYGILAPAGTPADVVARLNSEINKAIQDPQVRAKLTEEGAEPVGGTPADFTQQIRAELARLSAFAKDIKVE